MENAIFNRIAVGAYGVHNFYIACDLEERKVQTPRETPLL